MVRHAADRVKQRNSSTFRQRLKNLVRYTADMTGEPKGKVLMLDDELFLYAPYKKVFETNGYYVEGYYETDKALNALKAGYMPDIIISDITMPDGGSGYEFIDEVNKGKLAESALKIVFTNQGQEGAKHRIAELGADAYIMKVKVTPSEFFAHVEELFKAKQAKFS